MRAFEIPKEEGHFGMVTSASLNKAASTNIGKGSSMNKGFTRGSAGLVC